MRALRTQIEIDATPEHVWAILTDFGSHRDWNPFNADSPGDSTSPSTAPSATASASDRAGYQRRRSPAFVKCETAQPL